MLDYKKDRLDYGEMLMPPEGYTLAKAVAATYSLDLTTLLSIPIALFYAQTLEGIESGERIQLLEAIKRCPDVLRVYHQKGRISVPKKHNRLFGLLESCVIGVPPTSLYSSFHPKLWVLRYEATGAPTRYRVIVLSRNLTYDRSWDIATALVGKVTRKSQPRNKPLVDFVRYLVKHDTFDGAKAFISDLSRVDFTPPTGFGGDFQFHPINIGGYSNPIRDQTGEELLCVSPFVDDAALHELRISVQGKFWLFSRNEELRKLQPESLEGVDAYRLSNLVVEGESLAGAEDGEGEPSAARASCETLRLQAKHPGALVVHRLGQCDEGCARKERGVLARTAWPEQGGPVGTGTGRPAGGRPEEGPCSRSTNRPRPCRTPRPNCTLNSSFANSNTTF